MPTPVDAQQQVTCSRGSQFKRSLRCNAVLCGSNRRHIWTWNHHTHLQAAGIEGAAGGENPVALRGGLIVSSAALGGLHN